MRRLHIQFYLAILATLVVFVTASAIFSRVTGSWGDASQASDAAAQFAQGLLPPASAPATQQQQTIDDLHQRLGMELALYDADGAVIATTDSIPRLRRQRLARPGWSMAHGGPVWVLALGDGRRMVVQHPHPREHIGFHVVGLPLAIVMAFALGVYPIARRLTSRLGRLRAGVERLGQGDLATRVAVEGRDEVAALARSFNQSAQRIEELVKSHKLLLANCSHELRTPLARIRLGIERLAVDGADLAAHGELACSIAELDALIEEMLLASRLEALQGVGRSEDVDLLALAAEEAAHFDVSVEGQPTAVHGDSVLLRRMIRNLLDNARAHGGGATRVHIGAGVEGGARLIVEDHGQGVPTADRERIFESFYRASSVKRGFGLGLAIVRKIARAHGGDVVYAPLSGGGSQFNVTLPPLAR
jgi:signal transduction histidine kinase